MCIACEMSFWNMIDALPEDRERILREQAARFECEATVSEAPPPDAQSNADEREP
jgi:hypothetical protein